MSKLKIKLVHDYTKYNEKLEKGTVGYATETPEEQEARKADDHFVKVEFEGITTVDVLWRGLEIVDEEYLAEKKRVRDEYLAQLKTAKNVKQTIGAKGGFKELTLDFVENGVEVHKVVTDKDEAQEFITILNTFGIPIDTTQLEKKIPKHWHKGEG